MFFSSKPITYSWYGCDVSSFFHGFALGPTRSGKSLNIRMFARSFVSPRGKLRATIMSHDAQLDQLATFVGMGVRLEDIRVSNPLSPLATSTWSMAHDYPHPSQAEVLAVVLVPETRESQRYFQDAARAVLARIIVALQMLAPGAWEANDVVEFAMRPHWATWLMSRVPGLLEEISHHLAAPAQAAGVLGSLNSALSPLRSVFAAMSRVPARYSMEHVCADDRHKEVFLVMSDMRIPGPINRLNALLFETVSHKMLTKSNVPDDVVRLVLLMDELPVLGRIASYPRILRQGAAKGIRAVGASQDVESMVAIYGEHQALSILNQSSSLGFTFPLTQATGNYLHSAAGAIRVPETSHGGSYSNSGSSTSWNTGNTWDSPFLQGELNNWGGPTLESGVPAVARHKGRWHKGFISPKYLSKHLCPQPTDIEELAHARRPPEFALPKLLTQQDFERLSLPWPPPQAPDLEESLGTPLGLDERERIELTPDTLDGGHH